MKKIHWQTKSKVYIYVLSFENINMFAKGNYRIKFEAFVNEQKCSIQSGSNTGRASELGKNENQQYFTKEFNVRFQNEKVQLNQMLIIQSPTFKVNKQSKIVIKVGLLKAESVKNEGALTQYIPLKTSFWIVRFLMNSFCQYSQCTFNQPFLSSLSALIINQPISTIIQTKHYKFSDEQELHLLKKQVKKMRYNHYVLCNKFKKIFYGVFSIEFSLPKMFVTGQKDMAQVITDQQHLLNYLIMYETINLTPEQLNLQLISIDHKSENMFKIFKQNCQKGTIYLNKLRMEYEEKEGKRYKQYVSREEYSAKYQEEYKSILKQKLKILNKQMEASIHDETINNLIFKSDNIYEETKPLDLPIFPLIVQETQKLTIPSPQETQLLQSTPSKSKIRYLLILGHGYQGCPEDLVMIANGFKRRYKKTKYISLKSYKNKMGQTIQSMANSAVDQINSYLDCMNFKQKQYRIIMIGHSMGGLILRLAANKINYQQYLWGFISLGTPHLGYLQGLKLLIRAGLSLFSNIYSTPCLNQLSAKDAEELHDAQIYRMSVEGHLGKFKRVVLISSSKDKYVCWHSARIQNFNKDRLKQLTFIQNEMICNILGKQSKIQRIDRLEVDFKVLQSNMDKIIGRTCHIKMLTDIAFIQLLCNNCLPQILQS